MKEKVVFISVIIVIFSCFRSYSQRWELMESLNKTTSSKNLTVGFTPFAYAFGDVGSHTIQQQLSYEAGGLTYAFTLGYKQIYSNRLGYRINYVNALYRGKDNPKDINRDYSFKSNVNEFHLMAEYVFLGDPIYYTGSRHTLSALVGIGLIHSNIDFNGDIKPGTKVKDSNIGFQVPVGLSYQFRVGKRASLGADFMWEFNFTDYVDGISTQNKENYDILSYLMLTFTYQISKIK